MLLSERATVPLSRLSATTRGRLLALTAIAGFALAGILAKPIYATGATPQSFLLIRFLTGAAVLALVTWRRLGGIGWRTRLLLLGMGVLFAGQALAYYGAVAIAPVSLVVVVVAVYPLLVVLGDVLLRRAPLDPRRLALLCAAVVGLWLGAGAPRGTLDRGVVLALTCAVLHAAYLQTSQRALAGIPALVATFHVTAGALVVVAVVTLATAPTFPDATGWALSAVHGTLVTALPIVVLHTAVQRIGAAEAAQLGIVEPVLATALAVVLLGERLAPVQLVGATLVLGAMAATAAIRPRAVLPRNPLVVAAPRAAAHRLREAGYGLCRTVDAHARHLVRARAAPRPGHDRRS